MQLPVLPVDSRGRYSPPVRAGCPRLHRRMMVPMIISGRSGRRGRATRRSPCLRHLQARPPSLHPRRAGVLQAYLPRGLVLGSARVRLQQVLEVLLLGCHGPWVWTLGEKLRTPVEESGFGLVPLALRARTQQAWKLALALAGVGRRARCVQRTPGRFFLHGPLDVLDPRRFPQWPSECALGIHCCAARLLARDRTAVCGRTAGNSRCSHAP